MNTGAETYEIAQADAVHSLNPEERITWFPSKMGDDPCTYNMADSDTEALKAYLQRDGEERGYVQGIFSRSGFP